MTARSAVFDRRRSPAPAPSLRRGIPMGTLQGSSPLSLTGPELELSTSY
jgi:hypothetical protein